MSVSNSKEVAALLIPNHLQRKLIQTGFRTLADFDSSLTVAALSALIKSTHKDAVDILRQVQIEKSKLTSTRSLPPSHLMSHPLLT